jgi:hypothetical protein
MELILIQAQLPQKYRRQISSGRLKQFIESDLVHHIDD